MVSRGEYAMPEGLVFGYPVVSDGATWKVKEGVALDDFAKARIATTTDELISERDEVASLGLIP